jgi:iron(III) transport system ATP-binding protein
MGSVVVKDLFKKYDDVIALENVNLDIKEGEFFALLGPSGCGKTTTMRCIAGFEDPSSGEILIGDRIVNEVAANKRNCGMVFQSYALFPHYNVFENVAYSLTIRELYEGDMVTKIKSFARLMSRRLARPSKQIEEKVNNALKYVELEKYADRGVNELSGGQQQRVALARALVMEPSVLLMDEPLSNLDKKLRNTMRSTIRRIQQEVGITTIFVTHDQEEAMSMADRVAVMKDGKVIQIATPTELYSNPKTSFVADFVGSSNIIQGVVKESERTHTIVSAGSIVLKSNFSTDKKDVNIMIRPETIELYTDVNQTDAENMIEGEIIISTYLGSQIRYDVKVGDYELMVDKTYEPGIPVLEAGVKVKLKINPERVLLI